MNCKLRFYNARRAVMFGKELSGTDRLILMRSDPLVHVEFQFSDRYNNISFSSTLADGAKGCRFKEINYSHLERWDTLTIPMTDEQEDNAYAEAKKLEGKEYDLIGIGSFATDIDIIKPDPNKYWCSEAVARLIIASLWRLLMFTADRYTPTGLFFEVFYWLASASGE